MCCVALRYVAVYVCMHILYNTIQCVNISLLYYASTTMTNIMYNFNGERASESN